MNSRLFVGKLVHSRLEAPPISFRYTLNMLWLDLDELPQLATQIHLFGYNQLRPWAVHDRDYLNRESRSIREKLMDHLVERDVDVPLNCRIMLLTSARYFNYTFNPVAFYIGYKADGSVCFCVAEVNNTFGEKHLYVLDERQQIPSATGLRYQRGKEFHVSPFMDLAGGYDFWFRFPESGLDIVIDLVKNEKHAFHARLSGHFQPLKATRLALWILKYPIAGWMTMTRITTQAVRLTGKRAQIYQRPTPTSEDTIGRRDVAQQPTWAARTVLDAFARIRSGRLMVRCPNGLTREFGDPASSDELIRIEFHDWRAFRKILTATDIGLGESYMAGDWTVSNLTGFIRLLLDNREAISAVNDRSIVNRALYRLVAWANRNTITGSRRNISAHYDLSNDLFELFLDPTMTYSSAIFEHDSQSLEDAQLAKYRRLCERIDLQDGDHVLEIGCGWGGFASFASQYANCRVTGLTLSQEQHEYACARFKREGVADRVDIRLQDYRHLGAEQFDKVVSIEMFEAVGYEFYPAFFKVVDQVMRPGGRFAMQTITYPDAGFERYRNSLDWIRKYIFPGGLLPSMEAIRNTIARHTQLVITEADNYALDYAKTLQMWRDRFNERIADVRALGFDVRFERMWNFYLCYCEAAFASQYLGDHQITFARPS